MKNKQEQDNILVPTTIKSNNEIFAVVNKILAGSRMDVKCEDGKSRMARILGSKRRRIGRIRLGDLLIVIPWDIQDEKADIYYRYRNNQVKILKKKNLLPDELVIN